MPKSVYEEQMDKLYKQINKYWKTIDSDMVADIVRHFDEIADIFADLSDMSERDRKQYENSLLTKIILRNDKLPEASTFSTVLSFICALIHFQFEFMHDFRHKNVWE